MPRALWVAAAVLAASIAPASAAPIYQLADGRIHPELAPHLTIDSLKDTPWLGPQTNR